MLPEYPDVKVEIVVDYGLTDIVASRYDAGVRLGEQVARGMIIRAIVAGERARLFGCCASLCDERDVVSHGGA